MTELISVILPAYNAQGTLAETIRSTLRQSHTDLELLVIDDGSTDETGAIARTFADQDPRVRYLKRPHHGLTQTLNFGLNAAKGTWIARMDADDIMLPTRLETQLNHIKASKNPTNTLLGTQVEIFGVTEENSGWLRYQKWLNGLITPEQHHRDIFIDAPICHPSYFAHRALFAKLNGYRVGPFTEDYDLLLRADQHGVSLEKVPQVLLRWREHPGRLTHTSDTLSEQALRQLKVTHLVDRYRTLDLGSQRDWVLWGVGPKGKKWLRLLLEAKLPVVAAVDIAKKKHGRALRNGTIPIHDVSWLERQEHRPFVLLTVAARGAREIQRAHLTKFGWIEGTDFLAVQ